MLPSKKRKARKSKPASDIYCSPDVCENCMYIGEGDSICDVTQEIVLSDWAPTKFFKGKGCPYREEKR